MNTWKQEYVDLLKRLNGHAFLKDIYEEYKRKNVGKEFSKSYEASIRDALEKGSEESDKFDGEKLFYMVDGKNHGHYALIKFDPLKTNMIDLTQDDDEFSEGKKLLKKHIARERNQRVIHIAKKYFKRKNKGKLFCEVCGFDFYKIYGELGEGFIEAHHVKPVSEMRDNEKTKIEDIVMVCSNCHSMIHRKKPWLSKDELKLILKGAKSSD